MNMGKIKTKTPAATPKKVSSDGLWKQVDGLHTEYEKTWASLASGLRTCAGLALQMGDILQQLKDQTDHGKWEKTVGEHCRLQIREVQRFMQIYQYRNELDEMDPEWREKYTLSDALSEIQTYKSRKCVEACNEQRSAQAEERKKAEENEENTESKAAPKIVPLRKGTKVSFAGLKSIFSSADKGLKAILSAVPSIAKAADVEKVEAHAKTTRDECVALLEKCVRRREELEKEEAPTAKATAKSKGKAKSKATAAQKPARKAKVATTTSAKTTSAKATRKGSGDPLFSAAGKV
jgi:hypothetical protein